MSDTLKGSPVTRADITPEWIALRRELLQRCGQPARAGEGNTIEVKSLTPHDVLASVGLNEWAPIFLVNESKTFASAEDRDAVLALLTGK